MLPEADAAEAGGKIRGRRQLPVRSHAHVVRVLIGSMPEPPQLAQFHSLNGPATAVTLLIQRIQWTQPDAAVLDLKVTPLRGR